MKRMLGWLSDPYLHVIVIGLLLLRVAAMSGGDSSKTAQAAEPVRCDTCHVSHDDDSRQCLRVVSQASPSRDSIE